MPKLSAGLLMFRRRGQSIELLLVHPGGPFWAKKDKGAWSIPKGEYTPDADPLQAARREFQEETAIEPTGEFFDLDPIRQPSGKVIRVWVFEGNCDPSKIRSNTFSIEWPKGSGTMKDFPEIDRAEWFGLENAQEKIIGGQRGFLKQLAEILGVSPAGHGC
jgi:predicted NUDIX family NTP pyrophosphohydrolase